MNAEGYADPTAEKAIANVMREWRRKKHGKVSVFDDDTRTEGRVRSKRRTEKHRNEAKEKGNAGNAGYPFEDAFEKR